MALPERMRLGRRGVIGVVVALVAVVAHDAVLVPSSTVTRTGTGTSGLRAGQTVVLADLGATVPTSTTTSTRNRFGGAGGFGGGNFGGGQGARGGNR